MVSNVFIYWDISRKCQDICPDAPMGQTTFVVSFICPFVLRKQSHRDPMQAVHGGEEPEMKPCQRRKEDEMRNWLGVLVLSLALHTHAGFFFSVGSFWVS